MSIISRYFFSNSIRACYAVFLLRFRRFMGKTQRFSNKQTRGHTVVDSKNYFTSNNGPKQVFFVVIDCLFNVMYPYCIHACVYIYIYYFSPFDFAFVTPS